MKRVNGFIFIVTYGRSGSTVLQRIIQTIPNICFRGENNNVLEMLFRSARYAEFGHKNFGNRALEAFEPWFGADLIDPDRFSRKLAEIFIDEIIQPEDNHRWLGFKEIRYDWLGDEFPLFLDWISCYFPNTYFLFNRRDKIDVSRSGWWTKQSPDDVYAMVEAMDSRFADYHRRNPENTFMTEYSQFTTNPRALAGFFQMIGEKLNEKLVKRILDTKLNH